MSYRTPRLSGPNPWVFDSASNPILQPPDFLEWILGDPAVIQLGDQIHMFANEVLCIQMKSGKILFECLLADGMLNYKICKYKSMRQPMKQFLCEDIFWKVFHGILHFTAPLDSPTNFTKHDTVIVLIKFFHVCKNFFLPESKHFHFLFYSVHFHF